MSPSPQDRGRPHDLGQLEQVLGWASLALGVPQTLAPRAFARAIGAPDGPRATAVTLLACGPRELAVGAGILAAERPWPTRSLWARVAGDVLDMGLIVLSFRHGPTSRARLALAAAAAGAIGTADLLAAVRSGEQADGDTPPATRPDHPMLSGKAITIRAPQNEVEEAWESWDGVAPREAATFSIAPGGRGTELRVDLEHSANRPTGPGAVVDAAKRVTGQAYDQQVADDLKRFKQTVETGEVLRSDGSPDGPSHARLRAQRPAHPPAQTTESR
ncbi:hypothetical protein [Patulibacter sp. SYSU D01012]|uniref:hypothetical protein n=1 Tax=Patulibacter sp. SYSU D01012 TaxID=2817381 RepID=UPI001B30B3BE|nr:hypothetical protein [Patulibacter sp. SYSU D01012]